jgi:hypothetical protein
MRKSIEESIAHVYEAMYRRRDAWRRAGHLLWTCPSCETPFSGPEHICPRLEACVFCARPADLFMPDVSKYGLSDESEEAMLSADTSPICELCVQTRLAFEARLVRNSSLRRDSTGKLPRLRGWVTHLLLVAAKFTRELGSRMARIFRDRLPRSP